MTNIKIKLKQISLIAVLFAGLTACAQDTASVKNNTTQEQEGSTVGNVGWLLLNSCIALPALYLGSQGFWVLIGVCIDQKASSEFTEILNKVGENRGSSGKLWTDNEAKLGVGILTGLALILGIVCTKYAVQYWKRVFSKQEAPAESVNTNTGSETATTSAN